MAYNKAREERKWKIRKEAEEKKMRELGIPEDTITQLRCYDRKEFNSEQRFYRRLATAGTYIENMAGQERGDEACTVGELLDSIENEKLYRELCKVDKLTLQTVLLKTQGYSVFEIARLLDMKEDAIYKRISRFKKKLKKV